MTVAETQGVVWIASYPKSGNTWARCLIAALSSGGADLDINRLHDIVPHCSSRDWMESLMGIGSEDLTPEELQKARAYCSLRATEADAPAVKVHDRFDRRLARSEITRGAVYLVRDPRDVAPSWAAHMAVSIDVAIARMGDPTMTMARSVRYRPQTPQRLGSWSEHVLSWLDEPDFPLLVIRYEDMIADAEKQTRMLADFLRLDAPDDLVARSVTACRFDVLQAAEADGFNERPAGMDRFFRLGKDGGWRSELTPAQARRLVEDHGPTMKRLGYL